MKHGALLVWLCTLSACDLTLTNDSPVVQEDGSASAAAERVLRFDPELASVAALRVSSSTLLVVGVERGGASRRVAQLVDLTSGAVERLPVPFESDADAGYGPFLAPLARGRVLWIDSQATASRSATYDIDAKSFRALDTPALSGEHVHVLPAGDVLWSEGPRGSAIFDAESERWSALPAQDGDARGGASVAIALGRILLTGTSGGAPASYVFDPDTRSFTRAAAPLDARAYAASATLADGRVLFAGGRVDGSPVRTSTLYDPASDTWAVGPVLSEARAFARAVQGAGVTYVIGGVTDEPCSARGCQSTRVERLSEDASAFTRVADVQAGSTPRYAELDATRLVTVNVEGVFRWQLPR